MKRTVAIILCFMACLTAVHAREARDEKQETTARPKHVFIVGGATLISSSVYRGVGNRVWPIPYLAYFGPRLAISGPSASVLLGETGIVRYRAGLHWDAQGFRRGESHYLRQMNTRQTTMEASLNAEARFGIWSIETRIKQDVLDVHGGPRADFGAACTLGSPFAPFLLQAGLGLEWSSAARNNYHFGVGEDESLPGRPAWKPQDSWSPTASLNASIKINSKWSLGMRTEVKVLDHRIRKSPVIDEHIAWGAMLSLTRPL